MELILSRDQRIWIAFKGVMAILELVKVMNTTNAGHQWLSNANLTDVVNRIDAFSKSWVFKIFSKFYTNPMRQVMVKNIILDDKECEGILLGIVGSFSRSIPEGLTYDAVSGKLILFAPALRIGYNHWNDLMEFLDLVYGHHNRLRLIYGSVK